MPRLPRNLHLVLTQPCQCDLQKTLNTTRLKCCACHAKWRWTRPKFCACHENKQLSTRYKTRLNVTKCQTSKKDHRCRTYHRHGHIAIARMVADGCERLRTFATVNATSSEHTLNPQTPRMKREPSLRIRGKDITWIQIHTKKSVKNCLQTRHWLSCHIA